MQELIVRDVRQLVGDGWSNPDVFTLVTDATTHRLAVALVAGFTDLPDVS